MYSREEHYLITDKNIYYNKTLNYTQLLITCIISKKPCYSIDAPDLIKTYRFFSKEFNELLNSRGVNYTDIAKVEAYLNISIVNNILYNVSIDLGIMWNDVLKSTEELEVLRVENALKIYRDNRVVIEKTMFDLSNALGIIRNTKYDRYTHINLSKLLDELLTILNNTYGVILEYYELMNIIDTHRDNLYSNSGLQHVVELLVREIDVNKLGELSMKISNFITQLKSIAESGSSLSPNEYITIPYTPGVPYD